MQPTVAVIVPSFRRPALLERCLRALARQTLAPTRVVVAVRDGDADTQRVVERAHASMPQLSMTVVAEPGVTVAMSAAISECDEDVVASTDDDAEPRSDWIAGIVSLYDDGVGGVGGRDVIHQAGSVRSAQKSSAEQSQPVVGRLTSYGRLLGNHHAGSGPARDVDVLKGVNMSMRRGLWRLDHRLKGDGAQEGWEIDVCLQARAEGWRIIYDPGIAVDHYPAERFSEDQRSQPSVKARADVAWNEVYAFARSLAGGKLPVAIAVTVAVGYRHAPGPIRAILLAAQTPRLARAVLRLSYSVTVARVHAVFAGLNRRKHARRSVVRTTRVL